MSKRFLWQSFINLYRFLKSSLLLHYILFEAFIPIKLLYIVFVFLPHCMRFIWRQKMTSEIQIWFCLYLNCLKGCLSFIRLGSFCEHLSFHFFSTLNPSHVYFFKRNVCTKIHGWEFECSIFIMIRTYAYVSTQKYLLERMNIYGISEFFYTKHY